MEIYKLLSILLCYPEQELIENVPILADYSKEGNAKSLSSFLDYLQTNNLITLQEDYVNTFDRNPSQSLHLFEHIHGEDRSRGQALVDLMQEYKQAGFDIVENELPDYLPLFLEFLSACEPEKATELLGDAIHVIAHIGNNLEKNASPYHVIFQVLKELSPVEPLPLMSPPIRDMDEALEQFGPDVQGIEPLLQNKHSSILKDNLFSKSNSNYGSTNSTCTKRELL